MMLAKIIGGIFVVPVMVCIGIVAVPTIIITYCVEQFCNIFEEKECRKGLD